MTKFLNLIFSTAFIDRWNDQLRCVEFMELDKQAHKMTIAWLLAKMEEHENGIKIDYLKLIEYFISEFAYRAVVTDLKPPVFHYLQKHKKQEFDEFVRNELLEIIDNDFIYVFDEYLKSSEDEIERKILNASHFLATRWEYDIIYNLNPNGYDSENIRNRVDLEVEEYLDLVGVRRLELGKKTKNFISLVGNMRFQKRWAKTPRIPKTSVLGHQVFVAVTTYFLSKKANLSEVRIENNFFNALFHDLAESLTRDIISPVKYGVKGLDELLSDYEKSVIEDKLLPLLPKYLRNEMAWYLYDEFSNRLKTQKIELDFLENNREIEAIDGSLVKVADNLGAFVEAVESIKNGVNPPSLIEARDKLMEKYKNKIMYDINIEEIFKNFI
jgi:putative hydrolase of HD superfamily